MHLPGSQTYGTDGHSTRPDMVGSTWPGRVSSSWFKVISSLFSSAIESSISRTGLVQILLFKVFAIKIMICITTMAPVTNWWRCEIAQFQFIWLVTQSEILQIRIWISIWINAFVIRVDWALKLTYSAFHFLRLLYFNRWITRAYAALAMLCLICFANTN